jgi:hypothetical protein
MVVSEAMFGSLLTFGGTALIAFGGWVVAIMLKRSRVRASEPDLWKRLDELSMEIYGSGLEPGLKRRLIATETKADAAGRVIGDLARQWQGPAPRLNPDDLALLDENVLPRNHAWRKRPPNRKVVSE